MRNTWMGNEQKFYPWHETGLFSYTPVKRKKDLMETKYASEWRGMRLVSNTENRSRSPIDKERHGSLTSRIIEPELQDNSPMSSRKKLVQPPTLAKERSESRKKMQKDGKEMQKNTYSIDNTLVSANLKNTYTKRSITPDRVIERAGKKTCEKAGNDRIGNLMADKLPPRPSNKIKTEFVSHITTLPGVIKIEPEKSRPGSIEKYKERCLNRTESKETKHSKQRAENGVEQWRSSIDIIKHIVSSKTYY